MAAQSVSQVSFVPQSTAVRRKNHRSAKVLLIKVTKRPESASQQQQRDLPFLFPLGRWREILPRSLVIGRMVVIDLGVNVCASLSPSAHHSTPNYPLQFFPPPANSAATPSPRNPGGFAAKGDQRGVVPSESSRRSRGLLAADPARMPSTLQLAPLGLSR